MARTSRRSRRDQWDAMRKNITHDTKVTKGTESREHVPEMACGKCRNFSESPYSSNGSGYCGSLKTGSDISTDPPVYVWEGDAGLYCMFNMDASKCKEYNELDYIDTNGSECADPRRKRAHRQMERVSK